jgi:SAM-dependent methyltransferase
MTMPTTPSAWIVKYAPLIRSGGHVLDLACGSGRHAIWLAAQGYLVDAIDRDATAMAAMAGLDNIHTQLADLEATTAYQFTQQYDGIVVSRYLYRPLLPRLAAILKPGGVLIYETFMQGNERYGKPSNPDFLLQPNELLTHYAESLRIAAFKQGDEQTPTPAVMQRICALKADVRCIA